MSTEHEDDPLREISAEIEDDWRMPPRVPPSDAVLELEMIEDAQAQGCDCMAEVYIDRTTPGASCVRHKDGCVLEAEAHI